MHEIHTQVAAEEDLIGIWNYTYQTWGAAQADAYLDQLEDGITLLADNPRIGTPCDHLRPGYRRFLIKHHLVYYRLAGDRIDIIRVLHQDMDPDSHL